MISRRDYLAGSGVPKKKAEDQRFKLLGFSKPFRNLNFEDTAAPEITNISLPPEPSMGNRVRVSATIVDESLVSNASLFYITGGSLRFTEMEMISVESDIYKATIPGEDVTIRGLAYFIKAVDTKGFERYSDTTSISVDFPANVLSTEIEGSAYTSGVPRDKWRLISVPSILDSTEVTSVFGEELGGNPSEISWKLLEWTNEKWENPTDVNVKEGYWIYQQIFDDVVLSTGSGRTSDLTGTQIILQPGWNLIGSPYSFAVDINVDQKDFYGPFMYGNHNGEGWSDIITEVQPWGGYAIYNRDMTDEQTINIRPLDNIGYLARSTNNSSDDIHDFQAGWKLQIMASGSDYSDFSNYVGRISGADEGLDHFDNPEPPYMDGYISISMKRPEWTRMVGIPQFTSDIRSLEETDGVWDMELHVKEENGPITLSPRMLGEFPAEQDIILLDLITKEVHNLNSRGSLLLKSIIITKYSEKFPYRFKIISGRPDFVARTLQDIINQLPKQFTLAQNYPNPFNPVTRIQFDVPKPSKVTLTIYNIMGQEVTTLVTGWKNIGHYNVMWDGRDSFGQSVSSGVYMYRIRAGDFTQTRKMMLLR